MLSENGFVVERILKRNLDLVLGGKGRGGGLFRRECIGNSNKAN